MDIRRILTLSLIGCSMGLGMAGVAEAAANDCQLGQRYQDLAKDRQDAYQTDEALAFLRQAVEACPNFAAFEKLGELAALAPKENKDKLEAASAFESAYAAAGTDRERVTSLYQYAALLEREGSPQYAYKVIMQAKALDPSNQDVQALARKVEGEYLNPTPESIHRQVRFSMMEPQLAVAAVAKPAAANGVAAAQPPAAPPRPRGASISIPINFQTASVDVDERTRPNIEALAHALADPEMSGHSFVFVGHSDQRGIESFNNSLSLQRAQALSGVIVSIEPSLKGRISVEGHGSKEPLNPGTDPAALQANRRLQVLVK